MEGLHWIQFDHWPLRWLYFFAGISSCAMIASGLVFWIKTRVNRNQTDPTSVRLVRAISVASITGIIIASTGFLIANRLIPKAIELDGIHRHDLEIWAFFLIWLLALIHAALRGKSAWHEQSFTISVSSITAIILNFLTTENYIRSVLIIDLMLLLTAILSFNVAVRLRKADSLINNIDNKRTKKIEQTAKC
ncbi:MAG: hypothetical protein JKX81_00065 [Arenicella sp.]|nr:hypothetical protein [Arenicella sp.]